jgi:drug/metabolite transporter (DMT)-like permease
MTPANLLALATIALWSTLALLSTRLTAVPPFLLVGVTLCIGGLCGLPRWKDWQLSWRALLLGCYGLFGYHLCLFVGLRYAPTLQANLINYLWPLLIVLLSPVILPGMRLGAAQLAGGALGLLGCCLVLLGGKDLSLSAGYLPGYGLAALAALIWSSYSLLARRAAFPTGAVGGFCLAAGLLSLLVHAMAEPSYWPSRAEYGWLLVLGIGPMGLAFYSWDAALKRGDPRSIGTLAYLTPLASTALLALFGGGRLDWRAVGALVLILGGAWLGSGRRLAADR